jgi:hypothetical protein
VPGIKEKKRMRRLAACPGGEVSRKFIRIVRSTSAEFIALSSADMFAESSADDS